MDPRSVFGPARSPVHSRKLAARQEQCRLSECRRVGLTVTLQRIFEQSREHWLLMRPIDCRNVIVRAFQRCLGDRTGGNTGPFREIRGHHAAIKIPRRIWLRPRRRSTVVRSRRGIAHNEWQVGQWVFVVQQVIQIGTRVDSPEVDVVRHLCRRSPVIRGSVVRVFKVWTHPKPDPVVQVLMSPDVSKFASDTF